MSGASAPVIVIGAGIVGAATAAFLARAGVSVRLIEAGSPACGATGAADGAVSVASKRPGPLMRLARDGLRLYGSLAADGILRDVFNRRPTFLVASNPEEAEVLERHAQALEKEGVHAVWRTQSDALRRIAGLSSSTVALLEVGNEGHAVGFKVVDQLICGSGLTPERYKRVDEIVLDASRSRATGVRLGSEIIPAQAVVVAAGSDAPRLLGLDDILLPRKGQQLVTERAPTLAAKLPGSIISAGYLLSKGAQAGITDSRGYGVVIDLQDTGQFLIGSTREQGLHDTGNDLEAVAHMARTAADILPALASLRILRCFAGVRTGIVDGMPLIGAMPDCQNLFAATGFEGDGICLGPLVGSMVAKLVQGVQPDADLTPFSPGRWTKQDAAA